MHALSEIELKDGTLLKGRILARTNNLIIFEYKSSTMRINQEKVKGIVNIPDKEIAVRTREGNQIKGCLLYEDSDAIKLQTKEGGTVSLFKTNLAAIEYNDIRAVEKNGTASKPVPPARTSGFKVNNALRSAILPSWGQFHQARYVRGGIVAGSASLSVGILVWSALDFNSTADKYVASPTTAEYDRLKRDYFLFNVTLAALAVTYLYGIIDAGIDVKNQTQGISSYEIDSSDPTISLRMILCHTRF